MFTTEDHHWMRHAINLAKQAEINEEVPVGAVLVSENKIIGEGFNNPIQSCDPTAHAEIAALRMSAQTLQNYRIPDSTLYVTLEPCVMCVGALIHARVKRVVFGAHDPKSGALSCFQLETSNHFNHKISYEGGLLEEECSELLKNFFKERRKTCSLEK